MKTFRAMLKTELKLSLRGMDMFIFAICVPLIVLVILGILYGISRPSQAQNTVFWNSLLARLQPYPYVQVVLWAYLWWCRITGTEIS